MASLTIQQFLQARDDGHPILDVRTPAEFEHAHVPGAHSLPLFDNDERAVVGTTYKQEGRQAAIKQGLDLIGPKMRRLVEEVEALAGPPGERHLLVHCWRGGMRSRSVAWLLDLYGWEVDTLEGGYKAFRRWVMATNDDPPPLIVLGGRTGSGKTRLLDELHAAGEPTIDLEGHANHRGSAFGALQLPPQPSQEQFEALVALAIREVRPAGGRVWIEDESRMVGLCKVPDRLYDAIRTSPVVAVEVPTEERVAHLVEIYGDAATDGLADSFTRIRKRLGGDRTQAALRALEAGDLREAARIGLEYYDSAYDYGLSRREEGSVLYVPLDGSGDPVDELRSAAARIAERT